MDFKKAVAGVALGASLMGGAMDADAIGRRFPQKHHKKHQKISTITWDEAIAKYLTDPNVVAKVLAGESTSDEGMYAVACVIQNRMQTQGFASAKDVVLKRKQFEPLTNPPMMEKNYLKVKELADNTASQIGKLEDITGGATQFRSQKQYTDHKAHYDKDYDVTATLGGNVFMKVKAKA
jgi:hypothetical protein